MVNWTETLKQQTRK